MKFDLQKFAGAFDGLNPNAEKAVAGSNVVVAIYDSTGTKTLAISGQQGLTINRSAESIEVSSKDDGWKHKIAGLKDWSIDTDGVYVMSDESHKSLGAAFKNGEPVCVKVIDKKTSKGMFAGVAMLSDYPIEAPYDDAVTFSATFDGNGPLVELSE